MNFFQKMRGSTQSPPRVSLLEMFLSWLGAFIGIAAVGYIHYHLLSKTELVMIIGSFGASAVLVYGAIKSPLAQPRNLIGGHIIAAFIGVASYKLFHDEMWFASALAVATAIFIMHATKTLHPPAGATALIAVIGGEQIHQLGFLYPFIPTGLGALILLVVALVVNNIPKSRRYPEYWF